LDARLARKEPLEGGSKLSGGLERGNVFQFREPEFLSPRRVEGNESSVEVVEAREVWDCLVVRGVRSLAVEGVTSRMVEFMAGFA
jgi:hypothetical protein